MEILVNIVSVCGGEDRTGLFQTYRAIYIGRILRGHVISHDPSMFSKRWRLLSNAITVHSSFAINVFS